MGRQWCRLLLCVELVCAVVQFCARRLFAHSFVDASLCKRRAVSFAAEIVRQKDYVHQSEMFLKRTLHQTSKSLTKKARMATDDNIALIQCVHLPLDWSADVLPVIVLRVVLCRVVSWRLS
jgi:hypothetical protein